MLGKFRLKLRVGLREFVGPVRWDESLCFFIVEGVGAYSEVNTRANDETLLTTIAVVVNSDNITRLQKSIIRAYSALGKSEKFTVMSLAIGSAAYSS